MGHVLTNEGIKIDPDKVTAIQNVPKPTDIAGVQRLNGFVNYVARFLPRFSEVMEPIRKLTRKDMEWEWTETHEKAFSEVKRLVTEATSTQLLRPHFPARDSVRCQPEDLDPAYYRKASQLHMPAVH